VVLEAQVVAVSLRFAVISVRKISGRQQEEEPQTSERGLRLV
jgi:hypothetical protein